MRQFRLRDGVTYTVTWLPDDRRLRRGSRITLKDSDDPSRVWEIVSRGEVAVDRSAIHRDWRVGGL